MNRAVIVVAALLVVGAGAFAVNMNSGAPSGTALSLIEFEGMNDPAELARIAQPMVQGNPNAAIKVIEFGDYGCPACGQFFAQVKPQFDLAYGSNDDVAFVFYDFPAGSSNHSFVVARAARCAGDQGAFWEYHAEIFQNQGEWRLAANTPMDALDSYAEAAGIDVGEFGSCLRSDRHAEVVSANMALGQNLGVTGTPTVLVSDGSGSPVRLGNDFAGIRATVDAALGAGAESGAESGDTSGNESGS